MHTQLPIFFISQFQSFVQHWQNTGSQGQLANILIISISDGEKRAKVITTEVMPKALTSNNGKEVIETLKRKIDWAQKKFNYPVKWLRLEWVTVEKTTTWQGFQQELKRYKRNYFRSGIAYKGNTKPWCLLTEMELNANACLYPGADIAQAKVNRTNLETCIKARHSSKNMPSFNDEMKVIIFQTSGMFFDAETGEVHQLCTLPRHHGHRDIPPLNIETTADLISKSTTYLAGQVKNNGKFEYGHFPCFGRNINTYNTLRHASSIYSLIEGYQFCRDNPKASQQNQSDLDIIAQQIVSALFFLQKNYIQHYEGNKAYLLEQNNTIKLGANAVCILALVKFIQVFEGSQYNAKFLKLAEQLANGIIAMQKDNGQFVHVIQAKNLSLISENHVIYYDGEAVFGLMRLYGITKDESLINSVEKAFDYFIDSGAGHNGAHDHWLSYCTNEMVLYRPEKKYFQFAVNNVKGFTNFIKNRITTYPTLLELSMAFHKMLLKLDEHPEHKDVLKGFDVKDFYESLHARANYLVNGYFFPEMAMYYKYPNTIVHGCFIRHHAFRVRIDDVQHYLSGWVAYHNFISSGEYPQTANQTDLSVVRGNDVLTAKGLSVATGGRWLIKPSNNWVAKGLCIHPGGFIKGCILVARGKNMERGYLPKVAVKSFLLKGAEAIVTDDADMYADFDVPVLLVSNVRQATLNIGKWARKYYQGNVIGVTGSAGKTTTVAMLAHALQVEGEVGQTKGSANLPIGIAWNMASISQTAKNWVLEMAIGSMALNSQLVQPDIAIVTNIAAAHLEYHNTLDMVAIKKARIFEGMKAGDLAVICRDIAQYDLIARKAKAYGLHIVNYGENESSNLRLLNYKSGKAEICIKDKEYTLKLSALGKHMILNAMAILAIADHKGLDIEVVIDKLKSFEAVAGRGQVFQISVADKNLTIYDEAYNANPLSMKAALEAFSDLDVPVNQKVLILGDMLELGSDSEQYHLDLVNVIKPVVCREVILVGEQIKPLIEFLTKQSIRSTHCDDVKQLNSRLNDLLLDGDTVLIKASNGVGLGKLFSKL